MKFRTLLFFVGIGISAFQCGIENENCHLSIEIINNSLNEISFMPIEDMDTIAYCNRERYRIPPSSSYEFRLKRTCWEAEISAIGGILQLFFFDAAGEAGKPFTDCDDGILNSQILERREITIEYLRNNNWVVAFP